MSPELKQLLRRVIVSSIGHDRAPTILGIVEHAYAALGAERTGETRELVEHVAMLAGALVGIERFMRNAEAVVLPSAPDAKPSNVIRFPRRRPDSTLGCA